VLSVVAIALALGAAVVLLAMVGVRAIQALRAFVRAFWPHS
jgi:hypothetical protein